MVNLCASMCLCALSSRDRAWRFTWMDEQAHWRKIWWNCVADAAASRTRCRRTASRSFCALLITQHQLDARARTCGSSSCSHLPIGLDAVRDCWMLLDAVRCYGRTFWRFDGEPCLQVPQFVGHLTSLHSILTSDPHTHSSHRIQIRSILQLLIDYSS